MTIADLKIWFQTQLSAMSLGVILEDGYGLVTRHHLSQNLMGEQFNSEMLENSVKEIMISDPLVVDAFEPIDNVVPRLLGEQDRLDHFYNDIIVVENDAFLGLIAPRELLSNHIEHVTHQLTAIQAQQKSLAQKNKKLFDHSFKQGFQDSQVRQLFDESFAPMLLFDESGRLLVFNKRAVEVFEQKREQMEARMLFGNLFEESFSHTWQTARETAKRAGSTHADFMLPITFKLSGGTKMGGYAYIRITADGKNLVVNVLEQAAPGPIPQVETFRTPVPNVIEEPQITSAAQRPPGKITQAIQTKVDQSHAMGLARTVATNLIDRENSMDRLMAKLERIIQVAEQVEEITDDGDHEGLREGSGPLLAGSLSNFSVIDLCQILSQGGKTGRLAVTAADEASSQGNIYFDDGNIIHAAWEGYSGGVEDLKTLLATKAGRFEFVPGDQPTYVTIEGETMGLLMDACQYIDENAH